MIEMCR